MWDHTYANMLHMLDSMVVNVTTALIADPRWLNEPPLLRADGLPPKFYAIENVLKAYYRHVGLEVVEFAHPAFTVKRANDTTRWRGGHRRDTPASLLCLGLQVKYRSELESATESLDHLPYE